MRSLGLEYPLRLAAVLALSAIAAWTTNSQFHFVFATLYFLYLIAWILRLYRELDLDFG